jgi:hypothetical protein
MAETNDAHFDDELLSAYLDDELTIEERARVEERLSADPASRQLLDELRSVSQVMKGLPTASLGADLRDSVLRRAERAMLVAKDAGSTSPPNEVAHRLPFGRSKRAWIWAGMAVAAGLMLMLIEREADQNAGLPQEVAMKEPALTAEKEPMGPLTLRALERPAEESSVAEAIDGARPVPPLGDAPRSAVARGAVASGEPVSREAIATNEADESRTWGVSADDVTRYGGAAGFGGGREGPALATAAAEGELLVVHVSVTPEAMRNRTFDATLLNNRIEVEQVAREPAEPAETDEVEVIVVEAAPDQVYSTLADIKADTKNYVGIAVEQQLAPLASTLAKKSRVADVQQFNRGRVANQQQVQFDPELRNYYVATDQDAYFRSRQLNEQESKLKDQLADASSGVADQNQAVAPPSGTPQSSAPQTLALGRDQSQASTSSSSSPAPAQAAGEFRFSQSESLDRASQNVARSAVQKLADNADRLQVLFVLQAGEMAAPASAGWPVSTESISTEPVEQGLKNDE